MGEHGARVALGPEHDRRRVSGSLKRRCRMRVVELARGAQRPEVGAFATSARGVGRRRRLRRRGRSAWRRASSRSISTVDVRSSGRASAVDRRARAAAARCRVSACRAAAERRASARARARTTSSSTCERGTISSTSRQSTARLPLMPSSVVQNTSARSRRTLRLSVRRVSPPVPGSTASSGTSGSDTAERPSSTSMMWSAGERELVAAAGGGAGDGAEVALAENARRVLDRSCASRW